MKFSFDQYDRMTSWLSLYIQHTMGKTVYKFQIHKNYLKSTFTTPVTCFWSDAEMNPRNLTSVNKGQTFVGHLIHSIIVLLLLVIMRSLGQALRLTYNCLEWLYYLCFWYIYLYSRHTRSNHACSSSPICLNVQNSVV